MGAQNLPVEQPEIMIKDKYEHSNKVVYEYKHTVDEVIIMNDKGEKITILKESVKFRWVVTDATE